MSRDTVRGYAVSQWPVSATSEILHRINKRHLFESTSYKEIGQMHSNFPSAKFWCCRAASQRHAHPLAACGCCDANITSSARELHGSRSWAFHGCRKSTRMKEMTPFRT